MNNYEFCVQWVVEQKIKKACVLDYGCGAGEIVKKLRKRDIDAFGCDAFYEGGNYYTHVDPILIGRGIVKKMEGVTIPFSNSSFDLVVNNQVMEHVENLDRVLDEINRVLKPGGKVLNLFPDKGVWREGHCGVPFLHWFPKGSNFRIFYASVLRAFGLGYHKKNKSIILWSKDFCNWLDKWTYYREKQEIHNIYLKYFVDISHIEDYWLVVRLERKKIFTAWMPTFIKRLLVRKLIGLIFVTRKKV